MNTDFRVSTTFWQHRKTVSLQLKLGCEGVCSLLKLWAWTALNQPDGFIQMEAAGIEYVADWRGEPGLFVSAAVEIGWLDEAEGGFEVHDWQEHNPWVAEAEDRENKARFSRLYAKHAEEARQLSALGVDAVTVDEFKAIKRGGLAAFFALRPDIATTVERFDNDSITTVERTDKRFGNETISPAPAPAPALTSTTLTVSSCAEPAQAPPAAPEPTAEPALMVFPLAKKGEEYPVTQKDVDEWREAYPGIDVMQGLRNCLQWNRDNPTRRKTKGGIRKHISGWLAREQNRSQGDRASPNISTPVPMTPRQRYMRERVESIRAFREEIRHACQPDIIDVTPADPAPTQLSAAERRIEAPVPALPAGGP